MGVRHQFDWALVLRVVTRIERGTHLIDYIVVGPAKAEAWKGEVTHGAEEETK